MRAKAIAITLSLAALAAPQAADATTTGGVAPPTDPAHATQTGGESVGHGSSTHTGGATPSGGSPLTPPFTTGGAGTVPVTGVATLVGSVAHAPAGAPLAVVRAIRAGNKLQNKPYLYGGGHSSFVSAAYDCSGAVSFALHGGKLLTAPLDSTSFMSWGAPGAGSWITVYANSGHAYVVIAGLRLDTSGTGGRGPRWLTVQRSALGFTARHPAGL